MLFVELPAAVELVIQETEPGVQGDRSTGGTKPATLETGHEIQVPLFITTGEKIKVDTRSERLPRPGEQLTVAARNKARKRAFQILFEADQRGADVLTVLADWMRHARTDTRQPPVSEYTMELVEGYARARARIDELISQYAVGWTLDRMPVVDRNILRLGAYELIWVDDDAGRRGARRGGAARQGVLHGRVAGLRQRPARPLQGPEADLCAATRRSRRGSSRPADRRKGRSTPLRARFRRASGPIAGAPGVPLRALRRPAGGPSRRKPPGRPARGSGHPGGTFLLSAWADQTSSWATARRASASRTPQLISCSVRTEGDWS